jgi:hypothetical protein
MVGALFSVAILQDEAKANTYNVDLFGSAPAGISIGGYSHASTNYCSATTCAGGGYATPFYEFQPGDMINFGTISLGSFFFGDGRAGSGNLNRAISGVSA